MAGTAEVHLTNTTQVALVDEEDYERVASFGEWYKSDTGYAIRRYKNSTLRMHRLVNDTPKGVHTDHINHDRLDNRKSNLRTVSEAMNAQNGSGRKHYKHKNLPAGITWDYTRNKYLATWTRRKRFDKLEEAIKFTEGQIQ